MNDIYVIYVVSFLVFIAVLALVEGGYLLWRGLHEEGTIKINKRLKMLSAGGKHGKEVLDILRRNKMSEIPVVNRMLSAIPRMHALDKVLEQSGADLSVSRFLGLLLVISGIISGGFIYFTKFHYLIGLMLGFGLGIAIPSMTILNMQRKRHERFTEQLPDAMDFIARSLRAGNPFNASLKAVANEMPDPIGTEFGITFDEMNFGLELEDALYNLGERTGSEEMHFFITAVLIQRQTGGNLADVLNRIAAVMRARATTFRDVKILAAEMQFSARVLIALPFFVALILSIINPSYMAVLIEHPIGQVAIVLQLILMLFGYLVIRKMINFRI